MSRYGYNDRYEDQYDDRYGRYNSGRCALARHLEQPKPATHRPMMVLASLRQLTRPSPRRRADGGYGGMGGGYGRMRRGDRYGRGGYGMDRCAPAEAS